MVSQKVNILVDQETAPVHSVVSALLKFAEKLGKLGVLNAYVTSATPQRPQAMLEKAGFKIVSVPPGKNSLGFRIIQDCMKLSTQTLPEVYVLVLQEGDYAETIRLLKARNKGVILFTQRIVSGNYRWLKLADYHYFLEDLVSTVTRSTKSTSPQSTQGNATQAKSDQPQSTPAKATPTKATSTKAIQTKATQAQSTQIQSTQAQSTRVKSTQTKATRSTASQPPSAKRQQIVKLQSSSSETPVASKQSAASKQSPASAQPIASKQSVVSKQPVASKQSVVSKQPVAAKQSAEPSQQPPSPSPSKLKKFLSGVNLSASATQSSKSVRLPRFRNSQLLEQALTHRSYANEMDHDEEHNERLEFLGDCVLNFLCGEFLYQYFPDKTEGELTALRSALVNEKQLTEFAEQLNLGSQLRLGKGAEQDGSRTRPSILSSTFEALVGAYFIDSGSQIDAVRQFVLPLFESITDRMDTVAPPVNHKSELQHWAMVRYCENPVYTVIAAVGPDHSKEFTVEVSVLGKVYGQGMGRRKQDAEKEAARVALEVLGVI